MEESTQAAPYSRRLGGEESYWTMSYLMTWLAEGKDTGGQFALAEGVAHQGTEPPPHTHANEDEAFYVLQGEMTFHVDGEVIEAGPGDYVWLPRRIEHSFTVKREQAKALIFITPAGLEGFFKQLSEPAKTPTLPSPSEEPPDFESVAILMKEYGMELSSAPAPL